MLKPRKCRKLLLIISPQLKAAKGKRLYPINGEWAGKEFITFVNASPSLRPQLGMVGRKLGNIYRRHMEKFFAIDRKVDWTKLHGVDTGTTELPQRQTGQKALAEILSGKVGFGRARPTTLGGGNIDSRIDFNYHDHVPDKSQKHYFATPEPTPANVISPCGLQNGVMMMQRMKNAEKVHEGEVLPPELEIKGVHLKTSKLTSEQIREAVGKFGEIAEQQLIERLHSGLVINEDEEKAMQEIGRRCLYRGVEAKTK